MKEAKGSFYSRINSDEKIVGKQACQIAAMLPEHTSQYREITGRPGRAAKRPKRIPAPDGMARSPLPSFDALFLKRKWRGNGCREMCRRIRTSLPDMPLCLQQNSGQVTIQEVFEHSTEPGLLLLRAPTVAFLVDL
ncbi:hypothetical protein Baya_15747 [Bagarius yarrelli]|uniref:Uncharacterized protein n=1 Tax=Bagarius yarrelli TaxID=175774 RepID=A0A556VJU7_BAGYA|nr:hypothetical protein Baya_15747 [Bagarius yarrelli]